MVRVNVGFAEYDYSYIHKFLFFELIQRLWNHCKIIVFIDKCTEVQNLSNHCQDANQQCALWHTNTNNLRTWFQLDLNERNTKKEMNDLYATILFHLLCYIRAPRFFWYTHENSSNNNTVEKILFLTFVTSCLG